MRHDRFNKERGLGWSNQKPVPIFDQDRRDPQALAVSQADSQIARLQIVTGAAHESGIGKFRRFVVAFRRPAQHRELAARPVRLGFKGASDGVHEPVFDQRSLELAHAVLGRFVRRMQNGPFGSELSFPDFVKLWGLDSSSANL
ncbi:MAG TPA: hypothetical protein VGI29_02645 [Candidatus Binataceae bacterium]